MVFVVLAVTNPHLGMGARLDNVVMMEVVEPLALLLLSLVTLETLQGRSASFSRALQEILCAGMEPALLQQVRGAMDCARRLGVVITTNRFVVLMVPATATHPMALVRS